MKKNSFLILVQVVAILATVILLCPAVKAFDYKQLYEEGYRLQASIGPVIDIKDDCKWMLFKTSLGNQFNRNIYAAFTLGVNMFAIESFSADNYFDKREEKEAQGLGSTLILFEFKYHLFTGSVSPYFIMETGPAINFFPLADKNPLKLYASAGLGVRVSMEYAYDLLLEVVVPTYNFKTGTVEITGGIAVTYL